MSSIVLRVLCVVLACFSIGVLANAQVGSKIPAYTTAFEQFDGQQSATYRVVFQGEIDQAVAMEIARRHLLAAAESAFPRTDIIATISKVTATGDTLIMARDGSKHLVFVASTGQIVTASQHSAPGSGEKSITLEQLSQVYEGLTYSDVVKVFGFDGEAVSHSPSRPEWKTYTWRGAGEPEAGATISFEGNQVAKITSRGLYPPPTPQRADPHSPPPIPQPVRPVRDRIASLRVGMTFGEVCQTLNGRGQLYGQKKRSGTSVFSTFQWVFPGSGREDLACTLEFKDGVLRELPKAK
jgi:hypothetical protein